MLVKAASVIETPENGLVVVKATLAGARCATRAETMATIIRIAELAIQEAAEVGAELADVATGLVHAAIYWAKDLGITIEDAAASAADGALKGAYQLSAAAFAIVCRAVTQTINGVTVMLRRGIVTPPLHANTSSLEPVAPAEASP
jgi:hypothetical protein